jgi:hypothetical protein
MSPPGRPKGEFLSAQHEGTPVSPPGRPEDAFRLAQHQGTPMRRWRPSQPVLCGSLALLLAAGLALVATPRWLADAAQADQTLRQRANAAAQARRVPAEVASDQVLVLALPPAAQLPQRVSALLQSAQRHGVRLDNVRQSPALQLGQGQAGLDAQRVPLRLAGSGSYSAWRGWVADALQHDDAVLVA